jgi:cytochrome P450
MASSTSACPLESGRDDRKTAAIAAASAKPEPGAHMIGSYLFARDVLRSGDMKQAGGHSGEFDLTDPDKAPVFFLDGPAHKKKRATIARYFTPKAIAGRYNRIMHEVTDMQIAAMRRAGQGRLDLMSFDLAVAVSADLVGLTNSPRDRMARRLATQLSAVWLYKFNFLGRMWMTARKMSATLGFFLFDVRPAIRARRTAPQDDVISHLIKQGYSDKAILLECMTYAAAGMVTTREFIVVVAWHLLDNAALRDRFLSGDEDEQFAILLEILRLEPIAHFLYRKSEAEPPEITSGAVAPNRLYGIDLRQGNFDPESVGACPFALDPDRGKTFKGNGSYLSFGDGAHHCPGWQVALHETRIFVDTLLRVPGIRLERAPDIGWFDLLQSYELRNAVLACDQTGE